MKTPILVRALVVVGLILVTDVLRAADEPDEALRARSSSSGRRSW